MVYWYRIDTLRECSGIMGYGDAAGEVSAGTVTVRCASVGYRHEPRCSFVALLLLRGPGVRRHNAEADGECVGAL